MYTNRNYTVKVNFSVNARNKKFYNVVGERVKNKIVIRLRRHNRSITNIGLFSIKVFYLKAAECGRFRIFKKKEKNPV